MALGGFIPSLVTLVSALRDGGRPGPAVAAMQPLARAAVMPGVPIAAGPAGGAQWQPGGTGGSSSATMPAAGVVPGYGPGSKRSAGGTVRSRTGAWLLASLAGAALGPAVSSSVVTVLQ